MARDLAVVLVSGGMDSCVAAALARETHECAFLHVDYGQRTQAREFRAFQAIAEHYGVARQLVVSMGHLRDIRRVEPHGPIHARPARRPGTPGDSEFLCPVPERRDAVGCCQLGGGDRGKGNRHRGRGGRLIRVPRLPQNVFRGFQRCNREGDEARLALPWC